MNQLEESTLISFFTHQCTAEMLSKLLIQIQDKQHVFNLILGNQEFWERFIHLNLTSFYLQKIQVLIEQGFSMLELEKLYHIKETIAESFMYCDLTERSCYKNILSSFYQNTTYYDYEEEPIEHCAKKIKLSVLS